MPEIAGNVVQVGRLRARICSNMLFRLEGSVSEFVGTCCTGWKAPCPDLLENILQDGGLRARICSKILCTLEGSVPGFA